jgi:hypothetical protein
MNMRKVYVITLFVIASVIFNGVFGLEVFMALYQLVHLFLLYFRKD